MKTHLGLALIGATLICAPLAQTFAADNAPNSAQAARAAGSLFEMKPGQWRATKLTGINVYNNNNEKIGDVNELIVARDGKVEAVVIAVGGFLGMGEHLAAVPYNQVKWMDGPREQTVGTRTTTTGSGGSTPDTARTTTERPATTTITTSDRPATTIKTDHPATITTTEHPATTTVTADRSTTRDAYRGYPDHARVDLTKDQLKALPEVRYAR
ncbi:MAG TPA: PRC-barrel domain-containing protein [Stellaceae bacterium]